MTKDYTCNTLRQLLAQCFDHALGVLQLQPEKFILLFINSPIIKEVESGNPKYLCGMAGSELCELILTQADCPFTHKEYISLERSPYYWCGDSLGYYQFHKGCSFAYIFSFVSIDTLLNMYPVYHEMDISHFVDELNRLNKRTPSNLQKIRQRVGLSQTELATASKIPLRTIQAYEQKSKDINKAEAASLVRLAAILSCPVAHLLER